MISRDEALARARDWATAGRPGETPEVELHEFDLGWVASRKEPRPTDPTRPPASTGSPTLVVDRRTGEVSQWPSLSAPDIAARYAAHRAAEGRFPDDVRQVLEQAGWYPGRDVRAAVDHWLSRFADELDGLDCLPTARAALDEFGGLRLPQFGLYDDSTGGVNLGGGFTSHLHPTQGGVTTEAARVFAEEYDNPVFPIGNNEDGPAELVVDAAGRVFMLHWADDFYLGPDIDTAVVNLVRGVKLAEASDLDW